MASGGARPGAGRKRNGKNRLAVEAVAKAEQGGVMPLDYLLQVMRDAGAEEARRIDAAKAAAPYVHPKLQPVDDKGDSGQKITGTGVFAWQAPS